VGALLDTALKICQADVVVSVDDEHVDEDEPDHVDDQGVQENDDNLPLVTLCKSSVTAK
jgi:hypothetical protein